MRSSLRWPRLVSVLALVVIGAGSSTSLPAFADDPTPSQEVASGYPNWDDVRKAKGNEAAKEAEVRNITSRILGLQDQVQQALAAAGLAAERYQEAKINLDAAAQKTKKLEELAKSSLEQAGSSKRQAGQLVASMYRTGGLGVSLVFESSESGSDFLARLGLLDRFGDRSHNIYEQAVADANSAKELQSQADKAHSDFEQLANQAQEALFAAQQARQRLANMETEAEANRKVMLEQLAELQNTSTAVQAKYMAGVEKKREEERRAREAEERRAREAEAARLAAEAARRAASNRGSGRSSGTIARAGVSQSMLNNLMGSNIPAPGSVVSRVLAYARSAIGSPYIFGGSGSHGYDCSGLTLKAYAAAGIDIGTHSVNNQYYTARNRGQLLPYSDRQAGDLIFWGSGPGSFYHIGIYVGNDSMIAAPQEGDVVKLQSVWGSPWWQIARPGM